jgi:HTH-type transcriptional regulator, transcriptional repressor of NAD biosynthesis genes
MTFATGLVVGKFFPPHKGHHLLIRTALGRSRRVIVLVCDTPGQSIPAAMRAAWLREVHPEAEVRVIPDIMKDDDSVAWAAHTIAFLGSPPDAVFTSEDYGEPYARALGCSHVLVDRARSAFPVSGTAVRRNPYANWEFLEAPVRAHLARRVCVLGAESTGTTTLARDLAAHYRTVWVPEYGRYYSEGKYAAGSHDWTSAEFTHIARAQAEAEDWLARGANKIVICDTDPFATTIWHERYMGHPSEEVRAIADGRRYDAYVLTGDEIPFVQDGLRDGETVRHRMHARFEGALRESGRPFIAVRGTREERLAAATALIDRLIT